MVGGWYTTMVVVSEYKNAREPVVRHGRCSMILPFYPVLLGPFNAARKRLITPELPFALVAILWSRYLYYNQDIIKSQRGQGACSAFNQHPGLLCDGSLASCCDQLPCCHALRWSLALSRGGSLARSSRKRDTFFRVSHTYCTIYHVQWLHFVSRFIIWCRISPVQIGWTHNWPIYDIFYNKTWS